MLFRRFLSSASSPRVKYVFGKHRTPEHAKQAPAAAINRPSAPKFSSRRNNAQTPDTASSNTYASRRSNVHAAPATVHHISHRNNVHVSESTSTSASAHTNASRNTIDATAQQPSHFQSSPNIHRTSSDSDNYSQPPDPSQEPNLQPIDIAYTSHRNPTTMKNTGADAPSNKRPFKGERSPMTERQIKKLRKVSVNQRANMQATRKLVAYRNTGDVAGAVELYKNRANFLMLEEHVFPEDKVSGEVREDGTTELHFSSNLFGLLMHMIIDESDDVDLELIKEIYDSIVASGTKPDERMSIMLVRAYCAVDQVEEAQRVLREMDERELPLRLRAFSPVLGACCRTARADEVHKIAALFTHMHDVVVVEATEALEAAQIEANDVANAATAAAAASNNYKGNSAKGVEKAVVKLPSSVNSLTETEFLMVVEALARLGSDVELAADTVRVQEVDELLSQVLFHMMIEVPRPSQEFHDHFRKLLASPLGEALGSKLGRRHTVAAMNERLNETKNKEEEKGDDVAKFGGEEDRTAVVLEPVKWAVVPEPAVLTEEGACSNCGEPIRRIEPKQVEVDKFIDVIRKQVHAKGESHVAQWRKFDNWLKRMEPYDCVVDGANVAFYGPGSAWTYTSIDACMKHLRAIGKKPLLVLHTRHFSKFMLNRTQDDNAALVASWEKSGALYKVPHDNNDDWYWLYAALRKRDNTVLISNDQLRDHQFSMNQSLYFKRWREQHVANFHWEYVAGGNIEFKIYEPLPYNVCMQPTAAARGWHVPMLDTAEGNEFESNEPPSLCKDDVSQWMKDQHGLLKSAKWMCALSSSSK